MDTRSLIASISAGLAVVVVIAIIVGAMFFNAQNNRAKDIHQYDSCVSNGGTYIKQYGNPLCLRDGLTAENLGE